MTPHESVSKRPDGNVTPWIDVRVVEAQFPIRVRFLKLTEPVEDHFLSHDEAYAVAEALMKSADLSVDPSRSRLGVKE